MNSYRHLSVIFLLLALATYALATEPGTVAPGSKSLPTARQARLVEGYGKLPLSFEANEGQTGQQVKFLSRGDGYSLFLTSTEAVLELREKDCSQPSRASANGLPMAKPLPCIAASPDSMLRMKLLGSNPDAQMSGEEQLPGKSNYFVGNRSSDWHTNIINYRKVQYRDIYPGVDLVYYGNQRQLEHDFIVAPGADPKAIRLNFTGAQNVTIDRDGNLALATEKGTLLFKRPAVYQKIRGVRKPVSGRYVRKNTTEIGFAIGKYDTKKQLVIDPVLAYATYIDIEKLSETFNFGMTVDPQGNTYFLSEDERGGTVSKINLDGALIYTAVIGPASPSGIAVDTQGNAYITGRVEVENFPVVNAFQPTLIGLADAFITKIDPSGAKLVYSTYFGGEGYAGGNAIAVDSQGSAYIAAGGGPNLPLKNPIYASTTGSTVLVAKFAPSGSSLDYSTYLAGSSNQDGAYSIAVDAAGEAIITGQTQSPDFPVVNALITSCVAAQDHVCNDAYVTKLNSAGTSIVYSTFLGSGIGLGVATNATGDAFVTGNATPKGFPLANALYPAPSSGYAQFVTRIDTTGSALVYSTFLPFTVGGLAVDQDSNAYVVGTAPDGLPTINALAPYGGGADDAYIIKLNGSGSALLYATYLGGSGGDGGYYIALDSKGNASIVGGTNSKDFPFKNALPAPPDPSYFLARFAEATTTFSITNTVDHAVVGPGGDLHYTITVTNIGSGPAPGAVSVTSQRDRFRTCQVSSGEPCKFVSLGGRATVNLNPVAQGESRTISIYATAALSAGDFNVISNTATISVGSPSYQTTSATALATVRETADIAISSSLASSVQGSLHYVHTVTNRGPNNAHAVVLLDLLPYRNFIGVSTTLGSCSFHPTIGTYGAVRCTLDNPAAGSTVRVEVVVQVFKDSCPSVTNTTSITSQSIDTSSGNDSATVVSQLPQSLCAPPPPPPPPPPPSATYTVTLFDFEDGGFFPQSLNNKGDLLSEGDRGGGPGYLKDGATERTLVPLQGAFAFNDLDEVAGNNTVNGVTTYEIYRNGSLQPLNFNFPDKYPYIVSVNNADQVLGIVNDSNGQSGFVYQDGVTRDLGHLPGRSVLYPLSLSSKGEVSGNASDSNYKIAYRAFLYTHGLLLNIVPGHAGSFAAGVDSSGRVAGDFTSSGPNKESHFFIYSGGKTQDLGLAGGQGGVRATGINDCGEAIGLDEQSSRSLLYTHGGFVDLNAAMPKGILLSPTTINNRGQIFGYTYTSSANNTTGRALLTPAVSEKCGSDATIDNNPDSATIAAGGNITYTIKVKNLDTDTTQFTITDELDATTALVSCSVSGGGGTCTAKSGSHTISTTLPSLAKGSTATITVKVKAASTYAAGTVIMNTATVSSALTADYLSTAYTSVP